MKNVIVVGAGQAGFSLCAKLRSEGYDGAITLIGAEPEPPYQRPPLSKKYLLGDMAKERLFFRPENFYAEQNIDLRLGTAVTAIDAAGQTVTVGGEVLAYDALALTTGATPRRLPASVGGDLNGVYVIRNLADMDACAPEFVAGRRVLIIGGGYIGLEAAAVAASRGLNVTLIEMAPRILQRVACAETSDFVRDLHLSQGVVIRENLGLTKLTGTDRVSGADLADGTSIDVDFVVVGIGVNAETDLAVMAGVTVSGGIAVDDMGRTSDPAIWAAGDCAVFPVDGQPTRLESVQNAVDQAEAVALNLLGAAKPYVPKPWFWSDQFDLSLQIAGFNRGFDHVVVRPGAKPGSQSHWYYRGDQLLACDAMNDPRSYMTAKRLIEAGRSPDPVKVADASLNLKELLG